MRLLKGIPNLDSLLVSTEYFQKGNYSLSVLFQKRKIRSKEYLADTLKMSSRFSNFHMNVVSGFDKNKQIVIVDANNNNNFNDDKVYKFDKNFRFSHNNNLKIIDTLPIINMELQFNYNNKIQNLVRKIQVYPFSNYFYTQMLDDGLTKELALGLRLKDYWKGTLKCNSIVYNIGLQGINKDRMTIMIKPNSLKYSTIDHIYNRNFEYKINDTIKLTNSLFKIDSIAEDISKLFLIKLAKDDDFFSYRMGTKILNFELSDLEGNQFKILDVDSGKKYTLLDFWGTWCKPCRELTPDLKRINQIFFRDVNIIGIAYDKSLEDVKKYITVNEMNWKHAFSDKKSRSGIIRDLKITSYPTFILLDENRVIVYRGSGLEALYEVEKIIKEVSN
ncbi:TlpA disulfide reductase family protein [Lutibacter sp.]|uniref:TlpA family protein disulfide reductase n=1 Tax=Lutibacter sp. TaxID=1925666 RepID=UPI0025C3FDE5|nr:TlpA disulfide reductase family protein [Lutibacter sp.]MCF6168848.1 TlpA family protein disulfide reductase [Lutibacter sp.]